MSTSKNREYVLLLSDLLDRLRKILLESLPENATITNNDYLQDSDESDSTSGSSDSSSSDSSSETMSLVYTEARQEEYLEEAARALLSKNVLNKCLRKLNTYNLKVLKARKNLLKIILKQMARDILHSDSGQFFLDEEDELYDTGTEVAEAILDEFISHEWLEKLLKNHALISLIDQSEIDEPPELLSASKD
jgi:hypothetical protein